MDACCLVNFIIPDTWTFAANKTVVTALMIPVLKFEICMQQLPVCCAV